MRKVNPRVSVIIPVFRRQLELHFALQSLESEADMIGEVIVVDDASPERITVAPPEVLRERTRLIRREVNGGSAAARQDGIDHATGEVIAFLDSDDAWLPGKLAAQLSVLDGSKALTAVASAWQVIDLDRGITSGRLPRPSADPLDFASACWFCPGSTVLLRRADINQVGPLNCSLRRLEDIEWFLRFALQGGRLAVAHMAGTLIRRAAKSNRAEVEQAACLIRYRFAPDPCLTLMQRRRLNALLDMEASFASWTGGHWLAAFAYMVRSQAYAPRPSIHLARLWTPFPLALRPAEARVRLGL